LLVAAPSVSENTRVARLASTWRATGSVTSTIWIPLNCGSVVAGSTAERISALPNEVGAAGQRGGANEHQGKFSDNEYAHSN